MIILERYEGDTAVIEKDGAFENIPKSMIINGALEGDVLTPCENGYLADKTASKKRREEILRLQNDLWE